MPSRSGAFSWAGSAIAFLIVSMETGLFTFSISTGVNFGKLYLSKKLFPLSGFSDLFA